MERKREDLLSSILHRGTAWPGGAQARPPRASVLGSSPQPAPHGCRLGYPTQSASQPFAPLHWVPVARPAQPQALAALETKIVTRAGRRRPAAFLQMSKLRLAASLNQSSAPGHTACGCLGRTSTPMAPGPMWATVLCSNCEPCWSGSPSAGPGWGGGEVGAPCWMSGLGAAQWTLCAFWVWVLGPHLGCSMLTPGSALGDHSCRCWGWGNVWDARDQTHCKANALLSRGTITPALSPCFGCILF